MECTTTVSPTWMNICILMIQLILLVLYDARSPFLYYSTNVPPQLARPKVQNSAHHAPRTTSQASQPPSFLVFSASVSGIIFPASSFGFGSNLFSTSGNVDGQYYDMFVSETKAGPTRVIFEARRVVFVYSKVSGIVRPGRTSKHTLT